MKRKKKSGITGKVTDSSIKKKVIPGLVNIMTRELEKSSVNSSRYSLYPIAYKILEDYISENPDYEECPTWFKLLGRIHYSPSYDNILMEELCEWDYDALCEFKMIKSGDLNTVDDEL